LDVFAELGDGGGAGVFDAFAGRGLGGLQGLHVGRAGRQRGLGHGVGEADEILVLGDEVGFGVDFDQHGFTAVLRQRDAAFGGDAVGFLFQLDDALLAQPLGRGVQIAAVLGERFLAFHHAGAGALAQFFDQGGGDFSHDKPLNLNKTA
jgi:hypothetical protein